MESKITEETMTRTDDEIITSIKSAIDAHTAGLRNLKWLWQAYEALQARLAERNIVRISKENATVKFKDGALVLVNAGYDIQIVLDVDTAKRLAYTILQELPK